MLILTRKKDESIIINEEIEVQIIGIEEGKVKLGINAPKSVTIFRSEIYDKIKSSNADSVLSVDSLNQLKTKINKK